ncbi:MAG: acetyl-CoA carboxylase biotin carboxylase subunit [Candidatus Puniceispirillum sp.]|nr:acetyl-CoA carboxylase biotin carboxylase subunit [Candidatus Puniceispirillum sp.]
MFKKILIANRGEIALRIHRACREMGIRTVAVHSTADSDAMHVRLADESICVGGPTSRESYLNMPALLSAATLAGVDAIHPGVGFLSENSEFAQMVVDHDFVFIGPSAEHIRIMGDKILAKAAVEELGIPVVPGTPRPVSPQEEGIFDMAKEIGYPILVKAAGGGGGKGMQVVQAPEMLENALTIASAEAKANFGNESVFMERYLKHPRHIEIQVLADHHGNVVHLGERDCSIQRRHQKIWEEAPSPAISAAQRMELGNRVADATRRMGYQGVGTFEFLYENGEFFFIEMNTRIQVEHPISEMITGIDLIREQIRVATGEPLGFTQDDITFKGHAIECRINAEHPATFLPSPGKITAYHPPGGPNVRVDSALYTGYSIPPYYDSLISKLVVWGRDRNECLMRLRRALEEYVISGVETLIPLHQALAHNEDMQKGTYDIRWLEEFLAKQNAS